MAVDEIIMEAFFCGELLNPFDKLRDVPAHFPLRAGCLGSGRYVNDAVAKPQIVQHMRYVLILRARKHIHMDTHAA